jgi:hypothetical protein
VFEIDRLQVFIYLEDVGLNVSSCLELFESSQKVRYLAYHPHFRFDMGELTRVKLGYTARIRYDFKLLKALNTIRRICIKTNFAIF